MRGPIAYGLSWPERIVSGAAALDFRSLPAMTFEALDVNDHAIRFPGLPLAWAALRGPAGSCAVLNAANEVAVAAFLARQIRFDQIHHVNLDVLSAVICREPSSLGDLLALDASSREAACQAVVRMAG
jgi:1-deoxy-D-xylulose-5-phosphate reductoisomerase